MSQNSIIIKGARQNNLKNINVVIPRNKLVVITGISGSGKTTILTSGYDTSAKRLNLLIKHLEITINST